MGNTWDKISWGWVLVEVFFSLVFWSAVLPVALVLLPLRWGVQTALDLVYGKGRFTLAGSIDAQFGHDNTAGCCMAPHMVLVHKGHPSIQNLRTRYLEKVFKYKEHGRYIYRERLQRCFVSNKWGWSCWEDVSSTFDIHRHVFIHDNNNKRPVTENELLDIVADLQERKFPKNQPQWEYLVVPNYIPNGSVEGDPYYAVIYTQHHAFGDGGSGIIMIDIVMGDEPLVWSKLNPYKPPPISVSTQAIIHLRSYILGPLPFLITLLSAIQDHSPFIREKGYTHLKFTFWTQALDLKFVKELSAKSGTSFSSIALAAFCGAMRKLHMKRHAASDPGFGPYPSDTLNVGFTTAMVPYKSRQPQNNFSLFSISCALKEQDVAIRLKLIDKSVKKVRTSTEPIFNFFIIRFAGYLPRAVQDVLLSCAGTPAIFSNIPGPTQPMSICGDPVVDFSGWIPLIKTCGVGLAATSYNGRMRLCITTDSSLIPTKSKMQSFVDHIEEELHILGQIHRVNCPVYCDGKSKRCVPNSAEG